MKQRNANVDARSRHGMARLPFCSAAEGQSGQALVIVAIFMIGLLAIMALAFDGGSIYVQRRRMQNAADAGALAGTRTLCLGQTAGAVVAEAQGYAGANGAGTAQVTIDPPKAVTVVACGDVQMTFARAIGLGAVNVCAQASAACAAITDLNWLRPIAIPDLQYTPGKSYKIWGDDKDHTADGGFIPGRGWLNLSRINGDDCKNAGALLKTWMASGYSGWLSVGDYICSESGTVAALLKEANVGDVIPIVAYDQLTCPTTSNCYYHINTFLAFKITYVDKTGGKYIEGEFVKEVISAIPDPGAPLGDYRTVYLTE